MSFGDEIAKIFNSIDPVNKLLNTIGHGIGVWYEPIHIKRIAEASKKKSEAKAYELELIAKKISEYPELQIGFSEGETSINNEDVSRLLDVTSKRLKFEEAKKQQNIDSVVYSAYKELENTEEVLDTPIDQDWIYRFFDYAKGISNEEMQKAWGRILAGEVKAPGSFSLRTLETIKNMSQEEAQLFNELSSFVVDSKREKFIFRNTKLLGKYGLSFEKLLKLQDCGLINLNGFITMNLSGNGNKLYYGDKLILIEKSISLDIFTITQSGEEILKILNCKPNYDYLYEELVEIEKTKNNSIGVFQITLDNEEEVAFKFDDLLKEYKDANNLN